MDASNSPFAKAAREYIDMGWAVIPLRPGEKVPATKRGLNDWSDNPGQVDVWWGHDPRYNVGVVCGSPSNGLLVIDLDVHDGSDGMQTLKEWETANGRLPETVSVVTGSGGRHLLYRVSREVRPSANGALGVDIRCDGSYIVAPPSIHPNGQAYEWSVSPDDMGVADADDTVYSFVDYVRPAQAEHERGERFELPDAIEHDRNNTLFKYAASLRSRGLSKPEIEQLVGMANQTRCKPPLGDAEVRKIVGSSTRYEQGDGLKKREGDGPEPGRDEAGKPVKRMEDETVDKIQNILLAHETMREGLKLNRFDSKIWVMTDCIPGIEWEKPHAMTEGESLKLLTHMERCFGVRNKGKFLDALMAFGSTTRQQFDPMAEAIARLPKVRPTGKHTMASHEGEVEVSWDGGKTWQTSQRKAGYLFLDYMGCDIGSEYTHEAELLVEREIVARAFRPGCKADVMPVLVGEQGIGKSTLVAEMALSRDFFLEGFSNFNDEDLKRISGKLVVEIPELDGFGKRDMNLIKSVITRRVDTYRESYGRNPVDHPRTALFFGTTNDAAFLTDQTGNRRFLPIECKRPANDAHPGLFDGTCERDVRQMWAELVAEREEVGGEQFERSIRLPDHIQAKALEIQEGYTVEDPVYEAVASYLLNTTEQRVSVKSVMLSGLGYDRQRYASERSWMVQKVTVAIDKCKGWERYPGKVRVNGDTPARGWHRVNE